MKLSNKYKYPKELNVNLDTYKNPFQKLKIARENLFKEKKYMPYNNVEIYAIQ